MLLGHFLKQIEQSAPPLASPEALVPGCVVVAVGHMQQLRDTGLPCAVRFGIVDHHRNIICQRCVTESAAVPEAPEFIIHRLPIQEFMGDYKELYLYDIPDNRSIESILMSARMHVGIAYYRLRSYPGDDFVAECLTGLSSEELVAQDSKIGQHWWTPLQMTLRQGLKWLGIDVPTGWLPDVADVQVFDQTHHGIAIEGAQVIHFSTCRVPDDSNRIKTDSLHEFRSIGDNENSGSAVKYKTETPELRLNSRNRAVWVLCHAESWGRYNLMDNNCEHFSRYCRVGKKESRQVVAAVMEAMGVLMSSLPKSLPFRPLIIALGLIMKNGARVLGRPEAAKEKTPMIIE